MECTTVGLLLKSYYPKRHKVALLDKAIGRFDAFVDTVPKYSLCNGAIIRYHVVYKRGLTIPHIGEIEQLHVPFEWAQHDIGFIHHILELCLLCVPLGMQAHEVIDILIQVYMMPPRTCTSLIKKIIILRLLMAMGLSSRSLIAGSNGVIHSLLATPIDRLESCHLDLTVEGALYDLIVSCLQPYIAIDQLMTTRFLTKLQEA